MDVQKKSEKEWSKEFIIIGRSIIIIFIICNRANLYNKKEIKILTSKLHYGMLAISKMILIQVTTVLSSECSVFINPCEFQ